MQRFQVCTKSSLALYLPSLSNVLKQSNFAEYLGYIFQIFFCDFQTLCFIMTVHVDDELVLKVHIRNTFLRVHSK